MIACRYGQPMSGAASSHPYSTQLCIPAWGNNPLTHQPVGALEHTRRRHGPSGTDRRIAGRRLAGRPTRWSSCSRRSPVSASFRCLRPCARGRKAGCADPAATCAAAARPRGWGIDPRGFVSLPAPRTADALWATEQPPPTSTCAAVLLRQVTGTQTACSTTDHCQHHYILAALPRERTTPN